MERTFSFGPAFDNTQAFTLDFDQGGAGHTALDVPGGTGGSAPPSVQVIVTGCPCRAGNQASIILRYANPGPAEDVALMVGAHLLGGGAVGLIDNVVVIPSGASELIVYSGPIPSVPAGTYVLEAALLDPIFGVTLSRHSQGLQVVP